MDDIIRRFFGSRHFNPHDRPSDGFRSDRNNEDGDLFTDTSDRGNFFGSRSGGLDDMFDHFHQDMFQQMESLHRQMEDMMKGFGAMDFPSADFSPPTISPNREGSENRIFTWSSPSPFFRHGSDYSKKNPRDFMLKDDEKEDTTSKIIPPGKAKDQEKPLFGLPEWGKHGADKMEDTDLDGKISEENMLELIKRRERDSTKDPSVHSQPRNRPHGIFSSQSVSVSTFSGPDGLSEIEVTLGDSIEKLDLPGNALCSFCNDVISYGGKGKIALVDHVQSAKHIARVEHRRTNYTLGGQYSKNTQETSLFPLFKPLKKLSDSNNPACSSSLQTTSTSSASSPSEDQLRLIPLSDRTANLEAMILSMMAENNISFSVAPKLVELIRECCNDPKALAGVALDRCVAAYKLKYGVSDFFTTGIIECMKTCPFSLNIDEATSSSNKKVLAVLVSFYSPVKQQVVIEHLASVELVKTDASTIFNAIKDLMDSNSIPWKNLQSCLLDSCNVMRGAKTGVEARLREQAPHLLDINGDWCHHIHNAVKQFCQPFEGWVERLFHDLNTDFKWSSISKDILAEICHLFNVKFSAPQRFIPHRWLSVYGTSLSTLRLLDMLRLFYYPFTASQTHKKEINNIIHRFHKPDSKASVKVHHIFQRLRNMFKSLNKDNRDRKQRIIERLFTNFTKTSLILNFYSSALPMLKEYVCQFQCVEPMVHKMHDFQVSTTRKFLASFIKPEKIVDLTPKQLLKLDVGSVESNLDLKQLFIGKTTSTILKDYTASEKTSFLITVSRAYRLGAKHLHKTLPLDNKFIVCLSALDPDVPCHSAVGKSLNALIDFFPHYLTPGEMDLLATEVKDYNKLEQKRVVRDSSGREESSVTRSIGDKSYTVTTITDDSGAQEKHEKLQNMDEGDLNRFEELWSKPRQEGSKSPADSMLNPKLSSPSLIDPRDQSIFHRLFGRGGN
ncbi:hypothetical protein PoB_006342800 [Plakobranchus ocellatus]|uniref:Uncharacterized protein n=1 Tax=Plakobranchus ocellatus TaxID=259542 RepID=A0AAV4CYN0_9GAST|nr:hypothetical protein PoB_006342800 [Plakobranchus ocellatus]